MAVKKHRSEMLEKEKKTAFSRHADSLIFLASMVIIIFGVSYLLVNAYGGFS